jgi:hypothetical protein
MKFFAIIEKNEAIAVVVSKNEFSARKRIVKLYPQATLIDINKISDDACENDILVIDKRKLTLYNRCKLAILNIKVSSEPIRLDDEDDPIHEGRQIIRMMDQSMKTGFLKIFKP